MSEYTRQEVIAKVTKGESLEGADLSGIDLSNVDFSLKRWGGTCCRPAYFRGSILSNANFKCANVCSADFKDAILNNAEFLRARLSGGMFRRASFRGANLTNADLSSSDFESADLTEANISGANIYSIKTPGWRIDRIICTHIYRCPSWERWNERKELEIYRHDFAPGEFEQLYRNFPTLDLIFDRYSNLDHQALLAVINQINRDIPSANVQVRKLERVTNTIATLTAETEQTMDEVNERIPEFYARVMAEFEEIKKLLTQQKQVIPLQNWLPQTDESLSRSLNTPSTIIYLNKPRDFILPTGYIHGPIQIGDRNQLIQNQSITIIDNLFNRLDSPDFRNAELIETNNEFQELYDSLDPQQQARLQKQAEEIISEKAKKPRLKEKLRKCTKWAIEQGWDISKKVLINILTETVKSR